MTRRLRVLALELWLPTVAIVAWWLLSLHSTSLFFPPLKDIASDTKRLWLFQHTVSDLLPSLRNLAAGFLLAVVIGVTIGMVLGSLPKLLDAIEPEIEFARAVPAVALLPVAIIVLGLNDTMRIAVIAFGAVWPVLLNTTAAVAGIDPTIRDVERAFSLGRAARIFRVRLGAALPQILAGARISLSIAIILIVVSEMEGASRGIGNFILTAQRDFAITDMWSGMIVLGIVGYLLNVALRVIEHMLLRHYPRVL